MNPINHIIILAAAFVAVFVESWFNLPRRLLGVQVDLLPAMMVYAALTHGIGFVAALAFCGGLLFDSLSENPLGVSTLPLFFAGLFIYRYRGLLLRQRPYAQFVLGATASVGAPLLTVLTLLSLDRTPLFGWGSIWQFVVMAVFGGAMTPILFTVLDKINRTFFYQPLPPTSFRPDREIKRGRSC